MPCLFRICLCILACLQTSVAPHHRLTTQPYNSYPIPQTRTNDRALFFAVNSYDHLTDLSKPIQNAQDIAAELQHTYGFKVEIVENATINQIDKTIENYRQRYADGTYASSGQLLIFFSGHGIQAGRNGYFMAQNSDPERPQFTGMEYNFYRDKIDQINCQHILVAIDACHSATFDPNFSFRNDRRFRRKGEENFDRILGYHDSYKARVFWTSDGVGEQTPDQSNFAYYFLEGLRTHQSTTPYLRSSVLFSSYLEKAAPKPGGGRFGQDEPSACFLFFRAAADNSLDTDIEAWNRAKQIHTRDAYQSYITHYPKGDFVQAARQGVQQLEESRKNQEDRMAWSRAKAEDSPEAYQLYLDTYPNGQFRDAAEAAIQAYDPPPTSPTIREFIKYREELNASSSKHSPYKVVNFGGGSGVSKQELHTLADESSRARLITAGTRVTVLQQTTVDGQGWTQIEYNGRKGWIKSIYLK